MSKQIIYTVRVEFGDCDPGRIVWFPNFFRWIDAASRHFFVTCGVLSWSETEKALGVIGTPLVDTHARFVTTATYDDVLDVHTSVAEWREKSFVQRYRIMCKKKLIMECDEVRIFAERLPGSETGIRAVPIPPSIRTLCE
ncbi:MAG: acyl-CoA thioesterase [Polaromonas sp.]|nr:acyl-CoA thioesterase [Polaromonas sp.]